MLERLEQQLLSITFVVLSLFLPLVAAAQYPGGESCSDPQLPCVPEVQDQVVAGTCVTGNACSDLRPRGRGESGGLECTRRGEDDGYYVYRFYFTVDNLDKCDEADVGGIKAGQQESRIKLRLFNSASGAPSHTEFTDWLPNECVVAEQSRNFDVFINALYDDYQCCQVWIDDNTVVEEEVESNNHANHNDFQVGLKTGQFVNIRASVSNIDNTQSVNVSHTILNLPAGWTASVSPNPVFVPADGESTIIFRYFAPYGASVPAQPIVVESTSSGNGFVQENSFEFVPMVPAISDGGLAVFGLGLMIAMALTIYRARK